MDVSLTISNFSHFFPPNVNPIFKNTYKEIHKWQPKVIWERSSSPNLLEKKIYNKLQGNFMNSKEEKYILQEELILETRKHPISPLPSPLKHYSFLILSVFLIGGFPNGTHTDSSYSQFLLRSPIIFFIIWGPISYSQGEDPIFLHWFNSLTKILRGMLDHKGLIS